MELLSPAGNIEKLRYAYLYGADAAYIGLKNFSLRTKADNFKDNEYEIVRKIKGEKKLYGALNIYFKNRDIRDLEKNIDYISNYPFDAFIISDVGMVSVLRKYFPKTELHLSTQANCINSKAAKIYYDLGFSRIIPGRELSITDIEEIKTEVPELEIEVFVHGAMCLAYSGRCYLSAYMTGRSGNQGDCSHSCRWNYRILKGESPDSEIVLEEDQRPGEYFPVFEGDGFTTILSSRDLCMIDYLVDLKKAGVDSVKIEGRMKSIYYTAVVTRAYRKMIDSLHGKAVLSLEGYREELFNVSHREYSTGFFFGKDEIEIPTEKSYLRRYLFLGTVAEKDTEKGFRIEVKNRITLNDSIEYIGPDIVSMKDSNFSLNDEKGTAVNGVNHGTVSYLKTSLPIKPGYIIRKLTGEDPPPVNG